MLLEALGGEHPQGGGQALLAVGRVHPLRGRPQVPNVHPVGDRGERRGLIGVDVDFRDAFARQWNINLQRAFGDGHAGLDADVEIEPVALVAGIPQKGTVLGSSGTTVRMLQFEDIQCPICKRYTDEAFPAIVNEYVRPGRLKIDFRGLSFLGPDSVKALKIVMAAGLQNKLWQVVGKPAAAWFGSRVAS